MLQLDVCLYHGVDAREVQVAGCRLRATGFVNTTYIICLLQIYLFCVYSANALLAQILLYYVYCLCCCSRVTIY
jgi:hypothetical protein